MFHSQTPKDRAVLPNMALEVARRNQRKRDSRVLLPWSSWFADSAQKMVVTKSFVVRLQILERLEAHIRAHAFIYPNIDAQRMGKRSLLLILSHLITPLKNVPIHTLPLFYTLIEALVLRDEFELSHVFPSEVVQDFEYDPIERGEDPQHIAIYEDYREELLNLQQFVFKKLSDRNLVSPHRAFIIRMIPIIYFRIPILCGLILDVMTQKSEKSHIEVSESPMESPAESPQESPYGSPSDSISSNGSLSMEAINQPRVKVPLLMPSDWRVDILKRFDDLIWDHTVSDHSDVQETSLFYKNNPSLFRWAYFVSEDDQHALELALESTESLETNLAQQEIFFDVLSGIVDHVVEISKTDIRWNLIQGYWNMIRAFLYRVIQKRPSSYSSSLVECFARIAENAELLSILSNVILRNTSIHSRSDVNTCLNCLGGMLDASSVVTENNEHVNIPIPDSFCFDFFLHCLDLLLGSDDFQVILKTLSFIYMYSGRFFNDHRRNLFIKLIEKHFFRLFLHWSYMVRWYFIYMLVFQIRRRGYKYSYDQSIAYANGFISEVPSNEGVALADRAIGIVSGIASSMSSLLGSFVGITTEEPSKNLASKPAVQHPYSSITSLASESSVFVSYTELTVHEIHIDDQIEDFLEKSLAKVRKARRSGSMSVSSMGSFEDSEILDKVYCKLAIDEYVELCEFRTKIQTRAPKGLTHFQVACPELFYEVTKNALI